MLLSRAPAEDLPLGHEHSARRGHLRSGCVSVPLLAPRYAGATCLSRWYPRQDAVTWPLVPVAQIVNPFGPLPAVDFLAREPANAVMFLAVGDAIVFAMPMHALRWPAQSRQGPSVRAGLSLCVPRDAPGQPGGPLKLTRRPGRWPGLAQPAGRQHHPGETDCFRRIAQRGAVGQPLGDAHVA